MPLMKIDRCAAYLRSDDARRVFRNAGRLKWVQALGTGVDGIIDQPSFPRDVIITNIRGIYGAPVSEAAIMLTTFPAGDLQAIDEAAEAEMSAVIAASSP